MEFHAQMIAGAFVEARRAGLPLADYPGKPPHALSDAYAVQDAAIRLFGGEVAGWKVGRINPPWIDQLGVGRLAGPIFANAVQPAANGHVPQAVVFNHGFGAAEAEFVFRIGTAPDAGQREFSVEDVKALVDTVYCGFEIASSPFAGINAFGPLVTISDFGNNNGLLLGPEIPHWRHSGLEDWEVITKIDSEAVGSGKASAFPGGPMESVRFLIENLVQRGLPIKPGLLISSGAITGVHEVKAEQKVESQFGEFCTLRCTVRHP